MVSIAMHPSTAQREVEIINEQGLHLRPADLFSKLAIQYQSKVEVEKDGLIVDGESVMDLVTLTALQGSTILIRTHGEDAESALTALVDLVSQGFKSDKAIDKTT